MQEGRDHWWHELVAEPGPAQPARGHGGRGPALPALHLGDDGASPKGIMHTTGGYLTQVAFTHRTVFDLKPETDVYWCAADIGWVTGHSYIVYGPLANGATERALRGNARFPGPGPLVGDHRALRGDDLYTAPTAIRTFMKWGDELPELRTTCRACGSSARSASRSTPRRGCGTGSDIGGGRCPIVDTWWQTETGAIMISPLPGVTTLKPGSATHPAARASAPTSSTTPATPVADRRRRIPRP